MKVIMLHSQQKNRRYYPVNDKVFRFFKGKQEKWTAVPSYDKLDTE
ncbi:hypothetical protein ACTNCI_04525 [Mitsuokella jalaludinii]